MNLKLSMKHYRILVKNQCYFYKLRNIITIHLVSKFFIILLYCIYVVDNNDY